MRSHFRSCNLYALNSNLDRSANRDNIGQELNAEDKFRGHKSIPGKCNKINVIGIAGIDYILPENIEDFMADFSSLEDNVLIANEL